MLNITNHLTCRTLKNAELVEIDIGWWYKRWVGIMKVQCENFPGGSVVKVHASKRRDKSDPWSGVKIPRAVRCSQKLNKKQIIMWYHFRSVAINTIKKTRPWEHTVIWQLLTSPKKRPQNENYLAGNLILDFPASIIKKYIATLLTIHGSPRRLI